MAHYYVATAESGGDNDNPGTVLEPWLTFAYADTQISAGDTVHIRGGTYDQRIIPSQSGSSGALITYANYEAEEVTIRGELGEQEIVDLTGRSYTVIDGPALTHVDDITGTVFGWIKISGSSAQYNQILNCNLTRSGTVADLYDTNYRERGIIVVAQAQHNTIDNCYIRGLRAGIVISTGSQYTKVLDSIIRETGQSCIIIGSYDDRIQGNLIEGNVLELSYIEDGIQWEHYYADIDALYNRGTIIRNNVIRYNAENALDLKGASFVVIEDNVIYGTIGSGDGPLDGWNRNAFGAIMRGNYQGSATDTEDVIIRHNLLYDNACGFRLYQRWSGYNNTVVSNNRDYTGPDSEYETAEWWGVRPNRTHAKMLNNIVVGHSDIEVRIRTDQPGVYIDYNLYFKTGGASFKDGTSGEGGTYNFTDWKTHLGTKANVSGNDEHSIESDPLFATAPEHPQSDSGNPDDEYTKTAFHLRTGSPAIDAATHLTKCDGGGTGTAITVDDAHYFMDGHGITAGDEIVVGSNNPVGTTAINYATNVITVDQSITWNDNDEITLDHDGAENIGAFPQRSSQAVIAMIV